MSDELAITGGLDQPLITENDWYLQEIERVTHEALDRKDPHIVLMKLGEIVKVMKIGALALARGYYLVNRHWDEFEIGDTFIDTVSDYTGHTRYTVERYIKVWEMLTNYAPENYREDLMQRNIKDLIPIAYAVEQGYTINDDEWQELCNSPDYHTVNKFVREEIKSQEPRKGQITLELDRDGNIYVKGDGQYLPIAWVDLNLACSYDIVRKAINRLLSVGVMKK